jgi:hypothetical protein
MIAFTIESGKIKIREAVEGHSMPDPTQMASDGKRLLVVPDAGWTPASKGESTRAAGAPILAFPLAEVCPG